jgi:predicted nucleic acid-binding protein
VHYFDSSALAKLVLEEPESEALQRYEQGVRKTVSSGLARTELARAVARVEPSRSHRVTGLIRRIDLVPVSGAVLTDAGRLAPASLRSLDAIHLASALLLRDELEAFVAYDECLLDAASALGLPVASPPGVG